MNYYLARQYNHCASRLAAFVGAASRQTSSICGRTRSLLCCALLMAAAWCTYRLLSRLRAHVCTPTLIVLRPDSGPAPLLPSLTKSDIPATVELVPLDPLVMLEMDRVGLHTGNPHAELATMREDMRVALIAIANSRTEIRHIVDMGAAVSRATALVPSRGLGTKVSRVQFQSVDGARRVAVHPTAYALVAADEAEALHFLQEESVKSPTAVTFADSDYYASDGFLVMSAWVAEFVLVACHNYTHPTGMLRVPGSKQPLMVWAPHPTHPGLVVHGPGLAFDHPSHAAPREWKDGFLEHQGHYAMVNVLQRTALHYIALIHRPFVPVSFPATARIARVIHQWQASFVVAGYTVLIHRGAALSYMVVDPVTGPLAVGAIHNVSSVHNLAAGLARTLTRVVAGDAEAQAAWLQQLRLLGLSSQITTPDVHVYNIAATAVAMYMLRVVDPKVMALSTTIALQHPGPRVAVVYGLLERVAAATRGTVVPVLTVGVTNTFAASASSYPVASRAKLRVHLQSSAATRVGLSIGSVSAGTSSVLSPGNLAYALLTRQLVPRHVVRDPQFVLDLFATLRVAALVRPLITADLQPRDFASLQEAVTIYPSATRKRAVELRFRVALACGGDPIEDRLVWDVIMARLEAFGKGEHSNARPRVIVCPSLEARTMTAQVCRPVEHAIIALRDHIVATGDYEAHRGCAALYFIKGLIPTAVPAFVTLVLSKLHPAALSVGLFYDLDFKGFDGTVGVELLLAQKRMYGVYVDPERAEYTARLLSSVAAAWTVYTRCGLVASSDGTRLSGTHDTSVGNGLIQWVVAVACHAIVQGLPLVGDAPFTEVLQRVAHFVEGDDGFGQVDPRYVPNRGLYAQEFVRVAREEFGLVAEFHFRNLERDVVQFVGSTVVLVPRLAMHADSLDMRQQVLPDGGANQPRSVTRLTWARCEAGHLRDVDGKCACTERVVRVFQTASHGARYSACGVLDGGEVLPPGPHLVHGPGWIAPGIVAAARGELHLTLPRGSVWNSMGDLRVTVDDRVVHVAHRVVGPPAWLFTPVPLMDQVYAPQLDGESTLAYAPDLTRLLSKLTVTCANIRVCRTAEHRYAHDFKDCAACRAAYFQAAMMMRARSCCLIGAGCCIGPLNRFAYGVLTLTQGLIPHLRQCDRDAVRSHVHADRYKVPLLDDAELFGSATRLLAAARIVWTGGVGECERQGIDVARLEGWVDGVLMFLRGRGPMPLPPIDPAPLRADQLECADVEPFEADYPPEWWARMARGQLVAPVPSRADRAAAPDPAVPRHPWRRVEVPPAVVT